MFISLDIGPGIWNSSIHRERSSRNRERSTIMSDYVADYKAALGLFELLTSGRKAAKGDIRTALIGLFVADGTVREKAKATGVSVSKVQKDVVAGEWLSTHPKADALEVKKATDVLSKSVIMECETLAELQDKFREFKAGKKEGKSEETGDPEETGDTEETGDPEEPKAPKATSPESRMTAITSLGLKVTADIAKGGHLSPEFMAMLVGLAREVATARKALAAA